MTTYSTGTISVGASSTTVTGAGTSWSTSGVRAGDMLISGGLAVPIASVNSATSITLTRPWPGSALSGANYDIMLIDDNVRSLTAANTLFQQLTGTTLPLLAALTPAANKLPYFSGAGAAALADLSAWGRSLIDDADVAAFWATIGASSGAAQAFRRGNILGAVSQSGGTPTGALIESGSNSNGRYMRFADGNQLCASTLAASTSAEATWTFPAAFSSSPRYMATYFGTAACFARVAAVSATSLDVSAFTTAGVRASGYIPVWAFGPWY